MPDDWDGKTDRRQQPYEYHMRSIIREELEPIKNTQAEIERKIAQWEFGAGIFRYFIIGTISLITIAVAVWEWTREHLK